MSLLIKNVYVQRDLYDDDIRAGCQYTLDGTWHQIDVPVTNRELPLQKMQDVPVAVLDAMQKVVNGLRDAEEKRQHRAGDVATDA